MTYFVVYCIFSYLVILGNILGEITVQIKLGRFHLIFFALAPIFLPIYIGYWCTHMMNPGPKTPDPKPKPASK